MPTSIAIHPSSTSMTPTMLLAKLLEESEKMDAVIVITKVKGRTSVVFSDTSIESVAIASTMLQFRLNEFITLRREGEDG